MGFTPQRKKYRLVFEDPSLAGFEVTMRGLSTGMFLSVAGGMGALKELQGHPGSPPSPAAAAQAREVFTILANNIVSWNLLDDDGSPVPVTLEHVMAEDPVLTLAILQAWTAAIGSVPSPLPGGSQNGALSLAGSLPMEPLSPSPMSS